jgi:signal transduction histidine kinase
VRALAALAEEMGRTHGLTVTLHMPENGAPVRGPVAHAAYRIAQEALRNVVRHSGVTAAELSLTAKHNRLFLRVRDAGCGFPPDAPSTRTGLGIVAMRERAAYVGGALQVHPTPAGTTVEAQLPLAHHA